MTSRSMKEETGDRFDALKTRYDKKCGMVGRVDDFVNLMLDQFQSTLDIQEAVEQEAQRKVQGIEGGGE